MDEPWLLCTNKYQVAPTSSNVNVAGVAYFQYDGMRCRRATVLRVTDAASAAHFDNATHLFCDEDQYVCDAVSVAAGITGAGNPLVTSGNMYWESALLQDDGV